MFAKTQFAFQHWALQPRPRCAAGQCRAGPGLVTADIITLTGGENGDKNWRKGSDNQLITGVIENLLQREVDKKHLGTQTDDQSLKMDKSMNNFL